MINTRVYPSRLWLVALRKPLLFDQGHDVAAQIDDDESPRHALQIPPHRPTASRSSVSGVGAGFSGVGGSIGDNGGRAIFARFGAAAGVSAGFAAAVAAAFFRALYSL